MKSVLSEYRVLDLTDEKGHLAGRIFADLGADVIQIEPPGGDLLRDRGPYLGQPSANGLSLPWIAANSGKRSAVLDLEGSESDRELFRRALATADVVLESFAPGTLEAWGLGYGDLVAGLPAEHPGLVLGSITPYGQSGPYADHRAGDLELVAMGGNASMTGDPNRPPMRCSLPTAWMHAGPEAAIGVLLALWARPLTGAGQHVDVSIRECQLATLMTGAGQSAQFPGPRHRTGYRTGPTREIWACRDGWVSYGLRGGPARAPSLEATVDWMSEQGMAPEWLQQMDWSTYTPADRSPEDLERIEECFGAFFATRTMHELYQESLVRRILLAPCNDAREILAQEQLRSRDFFVSSHYPGTGESVERPAFFARSSRGPLSATRVRAPLLDEDGEDLRREWASGQCETARESSPRTGRLSVQARGGGCLEGLRVLELGSGAAGPVATGYLAEQGATVVRIESRRRPDFLRLLHMTRENRDDPLVLERAPMFSLLNPDKKSLAVDMKRGEGVALVRRLISEWADVVAENYAPGVMERWGLTYSDLRQDRPDLILVSGSLFGQTGPQRTYPGFGGQGSAISGFNHMTGWPESEALGPYGTITDSLSPRYVASALISALIHLRATGEGQHLDISQIETGVYSLSEMVVRCSGAGEVMSRMGNGSEQAAPHGIYPCQPTVDEEGREVESWIALEVTSDSQWTALASVLGNPGWSLDPRLATVEGRMDNEEDLAQSLAEWTGSRRAPDLMAELQQAGIAAGVVRDFHSLLGDPQLAERGHFVELQHPVLGPLLYERSGFRMSETPGGIREPAPLLGQHTQEILSSVLGLGESEIRQLESDEVTV